MAYLAVLTLAHGRRAGVFAVAGVALGLAIVGGAAALGLSALISSSPAMYQGLRWAGVAYLLWLAWETWRDGVGAGGAEGSEFNNVTDAGYFSRGLVTNLLNPKAALFYVAVLPMHLDPARPVLGQSILLSLIYVLIATVIHSTIVVLAGSARPLLAHAETDKKVHRVFALLLVGVAVWFSVGTAR